MKKRMDKTLILTTILCLAPVLLSIVLYSRLPEQIPVHFDASGNVDGYAPKALAAFGLPVLMAVLNLFTHWMMNSDPKRANSSAVMKLIAKWLIPVLSVILVPVSLFIALGAKIPIEMIAPAFVGVLIIAMGNYLPKCKQNFTVGIRLPWTLNSEENWNRTHHVAGYLWMCGGVAVLLSAFTKGAWLISSIVVLFILVLIPMGYSYWLYKKGI